MWWLIVTIAAIAACCWIVLRPYKYWTDKGVPQSSPIFPLGDSWRTIFQRESYVDFIQKLYIQHPEARYSGFYQFLIPTLLIRDLDLVKQITVRDFDHFVDHRSFVPDDIDPFWGRNLFSLTGQRWRAMRTTLSPAFTSSKMKNMFALISKNGQQFVQHFLKRNEDLITVEMKDIYTRFANDVIANTAFGVEVDSLEEQDNEFYRMGKKATDLTGLRTMAKITGFFLLPKLCKGLGLTVFSREVKQFFTGVIKANIQSREKHGIVRPDMLHLLLEARKGRLKSEEDTGCATEVATNPNLEITDEDITYQAFIFFFAGFDSVSSTMSFTSYELAINPEVQARLRQEVDDTLQACKGQLTYEALLGMKYLDMVVCEGLRKWPNTIALDRVCTKPYTIRPKRPEEKALHLKVNDVVWIPMMAFHRDPEHFPDPDRFDPERFSEENKGNVKPYAYLPFGSGPRNCIGSRFALMETKILFFHILTHFEIVPVEQTQIPLVLTTKAATMTAEGGFWLGFKRRVKSS